MSSIQDCDTNVHLSSSQPPLTAYLSCRVGVLNLIPDLLGISMSVSAFSPLRRRFPDRQRPALPAAAVCLLELRSGDGGHGRTAAQPAPAFLSSCPGRSIDRSVRPLGGPTRYSSLSAPAARDLFDGRRRRWVRSAVKSWRAARQAARPSGGTGGSDGGRRHLTDQGSISLAPLARLRYSI